MTLDLKFDDVISFFLYFIALKIEKTLCYFTLKKSNNYPNSNFLWHAPLIITHIMHIYAEYELNKLWTKGSIPNITQTKFQSILTIRRVFSKVWFPAPRNFIPPKNPGLIGLKQALNHGVVLRKVQRVIQFNQEDGLNHTIWLLY